MTTFVNRMNTWALALAFALATESVFAAKQPGIGPQPAVSAVKQFTVADGLQVSLFAPEPMVRNPTDMDIDERGRIWITEGVNYRSSFQPWGILEPAGDR